MIFVVDSKLAKRHESLRKALPYVCVKTALIGAKFALGGWSWPVCIATIASVGILTGTVVMLWTAGRKLDRQSC